MTGIAIPAPGLSIDKSDGRYRIDVHCELGPLETVEFLVMLDEHGLHVKFYPTDDKSPYGVYSDKSVSNRSYRIVKVTTVPGDKMIKVLIGKITENAIVLENDRRLIENLVAQNVRAENIGQVYNLRLGPEERPMQFLECSVNFDLEGLNVDFCENDPNIISSRCVNTEFRANTHCILQVSGKCFEGELMVVIRNRI